MDVKFMERSSCFMTTTTITTSWIWGMMVMRWQSAVSVMTKIFTWRMQQLGLMNLQVDFTKKIILNYVIFAYRNEKDHESPGRNWRGRGSGSKSPGCQARIQHPVWGHDWLWVHLGQQHICTSSVHPSLALHSWLCCSSQVQGEVLSY